MACGIAPLLQQSPAAEPQQQTASGVRIGRTFDVPPQTSDGLRGYADNRALPQDVQSWQPAQPPMPASSTSPVGRFGSPDDYSVRFVGGSVGDSQAAQTIPTVANDGKYGSQIKLIVPAPREGAAGDAASENRNGNSAIRLLTFEHLQPPVAKTADDKTRALFDAPPLSAQKTAAAKAGAPEEPKIEPVKQSATEPATTKNSDSRFADLYKRFSTSSRRTANITSDEETTTAPPKPPAPSKLDENSSQASENELTTTSPSDEPSADESASTADSQSEDNTLALPTIYLPVPRMVVTEKSQEKIAGPLTPQGTKPSADVEPIRIAKPTGPRPQVVHPAALANAAHNLPTQPAEKTPEIVRSPSHDKSSEKADDTSGKNPQEPQSKTIPTAPARKQELANAKPPISAPNVDAPLTDAPLTDAPPLASSIPKPQTELSPLRAPQITQHTANLIPPKPVADAEVEDLTPPQPPAESVGRPQAAQASFTSHARDAQSNLAAIEQLYKRGLVPFEPIAQLQPGAPGNPFLDDPDETDPHAPTPFEVLGPSGEMNVTVRRNKILRCKDNLTRVAVVDDKIVEFVQFSPREISIIGREVGATHVTFWFADETQRPITYLVRVTPDPELQNETEHEYQILEEVLAELFPDSKVYLIPVADKLIVRGQAKDAEEAAQILGILRGEENNIGSGRRGRLVGGNAATPIPGGRARTARNVVNMLQIPGVHQIALRVKIAELNRSAARNSGLNFDAKIRFNGGRDGQLLLNTLLNSTTTASIFGTFDDFDIDLGLNYLKSQGVIRVLSEPTLVTMNGKSANFHAGGQFAVPTAVGVGGIGAVATEFKLFGVSLSFLPTILDKDRIRLEISPSFSQVDAGLSVGGTPGITDRSVETTVEMREGQTLAIAGLLEDTMKSGTAVDLPFLPRVFGKRNTSREETELIILVTPELIHPMEPEAVPPLPGFDVTEPTDHQFYLGGRIEGLPTHEHRSTVWPRLRHRYQRGGSEMISGPFGHGQ